MGRDVPTRPAVSSRVELRLAGTFGVVRDGTELPESELGSRKSRTLLKLLAVERPGLVPVDRIVEGGRLIQLGGPLIPFHALKQD